MKEEELIGPQELKEIFPKGEQDEASDDENVEVSCLFFGNLKLAYPWKRRREKVFNFRDHLQVLLLCNKRII